MKDDHMRNGQLKPAYNVQIGTENQFILGYSIHQKSTDTSHFIPHLDKVKEHLKIFPENIIADAGYGSEENYTYLEENKLGNYVKFSYFHREQKKKFKENRYRVENLQYDPARDEYTCPAGKKLRYLTTKKSKSANGFIIHERIYECVDCTGCAEREACHRSGENRRIRIRPKLNEFKDKVRENLNSEEGKRLRSLRPVEVESVYGQIKHNKRFKKFLLRGLEKVSIEWGLISIAHNMMKVPG
jgi:hypothetical protein